MSVARGEGKVGTCGASRAVIVRRLQANVMGWLFMSSLEGYAGRREYLDAQFTFDRPDRRVRVPRSALVGMKTYYAALELNKPDRLRQVCAMICLVKYNLRDGRGEIFGYKDTDETMGRFEARCPTAILDLLTRPTTLTR